MQTAVVQRTSGFVGGEVVCLALFWMVCLLLSSAFWVYFKYQTQCTASETTVKNTNSAQLKRMLAITK